MYINTRQVVAFHLGTTETNIDNQLNTRNWAPYIIIKYGAFITAIDINKIPKENR